MMGSNGADEVMISAVDEAECSETTVEIKIKTLDSQTYTLRVNKRVPVPELKEQIATVTGVLSDQQRLICRGKVLKDDQLLSAYHVEDGHTLHMVVRQPLPPLSESAAGTIGSESVHDHSGLAGQDRGVTLAHSVLLGSFNVADQGDSGMPDLNRIVSAVLGSLGMGSIGNSSNGMANMGFPMEPGSVRSEIASGATGTSSTQSHPQLDPLHGAFEHPNTASLGSLQPPVIPDSLTTLSQYLSHLRNEFGAIGGQRNVAADAAVHSNEDRADNTASRSGAGQAGLPTAVSLADFMLSTRQTLVNEVGECLSQLARQLADQENVTTPSLRAGIQTSAMRTGVLLQNLGALLLELGRTTMTLRVGQTPSDAVVNAGPAVFISTSGPNPIMVQPLPFQPGAGFGASPLGTVSAGSALSGVFPRNIDIRIRTGSSMSSSNLNQGEQAAVQQRAPTQTGPRDSSAATGHQEGARVSSGSSFNGASGVRVVPIRRTVVTAVPAAVTRSISSTPGNSTGLLFPIIARVQQAGPAQSNDVRASQPSSQNQTSIPETGQQHTPGSAAQPQNVRVTIGTTLRDGYADISNLFAARAASAVASMRPPANIRADQHPYGMPNLSSPELLVSNSRRQPNENGQEAARQADLPSEQNQNANLGFPAQGTEFANSQNAGSETPRYGMTEGLFLSRLLREVFPYVSQTSTPEPNAVLPERADVSQNRNSQDLSALSEERPTDAAGTSRRPDDLPPTSPDAKRQKRE